MQGMMDKVDKVVPQIKRVVRDVVKGVTNVLEERVIAGGTVTTHGLK
jgi:hypothetical protein